MNPWLDDGDLRLYHGDALETVRQLPDESVDCVVTSPPYWGLRDYGIDGQMGLEETPDVFVHNMVELFREIRRVLAPHGTCWVNLGDSYAANVGGHKEKPGPGEQAVPSAWRGDPGQTPVKHPTKPKDLVGIPWRVAFALQADGWWLRSDIIWAKPNPMPESVTDRPTKAHEYVFLLTKQPRYWFDTEAVREPAEYGFRPTKNGNIFDRVGSAESSPEKTPGVITHGSNPATGRNVRSVWQIPTQPYPEAHFATYPEELARRCILAGCPTRVCDAIVCGSCGTPHPTLRSSALAGFAAGLEPPTSIPATVQEELRHLRDVLRGQESLHLRTELSEQAEGGAVSVESDSEGDSDSGTHLPPRIHPTEDAGSPAGGEGIHPRTPLRDGATDRADAGTVGACSPSERDQARQPAGELEHRLEQQASRLGHLPSLRDWLLHSLACPGCGTRGFRVCGKPSERIVDVTHYSSTYGDSRRADVADSNDQKGSRDQFQTHAYAERKRKEVETVGWSDCGHNNWRPGVVLDPFIGSGTTAKVARDHQRHAIGIDLNETYLELAARRLQQLSLLNAP